MRYDQYNEFSVKTLWTANPILTCSFCASRPYYCLSLAL
jgi:hypothetical protein